MQMINEKESKKNGGPVWTQGYREEEEEGVIIKKKPKPSLYLSNSFNRYIL
jgi:hypothetical protein